MVDAGSEPTYAVKIRVPPWALDISYNAFCAKKTVHYLDYIGAELVRDRVG